MDYPEVAPEAQPSQCVLDARLLEPGRMVLALAHVLPGVQQAVGEVAALGCEVAAGFKVAATAGRVDTLPPRLPAAFQLVRRQVLAVELRGAHGDHGRNQPLLAPLLVNSQVGGLEGGGDLGDELRHE